MPAACYDATGSKGVDVHGLRVVARCKFNDFALVDREASTRVQLPDVVVLKVAILRGWKFTSCHKVICHVRHPILFAEYNARGASKVGLLSFRISAIKSR